MTWAYTGPTTDPLALETPTGPLKDPTESIEAPKDPKEATLRETNTARELSLTLLEVPTDPIIYIIEFSIDPLDN